MKAIKVYKKVKKAFSLLDFKLKEETRSAVVFAAEITAKEYFDDAVYAEIAVYSFGTCNVILTFGELEENDNNYRRINEFNQNAMFAKAYIALIEDKKFLQLRYALFSKNKAEAIDDISFALMNVLDEEVLKYLQPIVKATK